MKAVASVLLLTGLICISNSRPAEAARPTVVLLGTALTDSENNVNGYAGFLGVTSRNRSSSYFEVVVGNLSQPVDTTLTVLLDDTPVGTLTVKEGRGGQGWARLILNSRRGDVMPAVSAGNIITVVEPGGATIATGTFRRFR